MSDRPGPRRPPGRRGPSASGEDPRDPPPPWLVLGAALRAAWESGTEERVQVRSDAGEPDVLSTDWLLRGPDRLPELERLALERARGRVLDVGAGGGAHALPLAERGLAVTALERSPDAVAVLSARGVRDARVGDVLDPDGAWHREERWDTVLLLMNGTTLVGTPEALEALLASVARRLAPGGRVLVDSVDLREEGWEGDRRADGRYVGEVQLQLAWGSLRTDPFPVLYADPELLRRRAAAVGLGACEVVARAEGGAFLAELRTEG